MADVDSIAAGLADVFMGQKLDNLTRLKGGYSRQMWSFDADEIGLILCTDSVEGVVGADSLSRSDEALLLRELHAAGLPVPGIVVAGAADQPFGQPWFVMQRLPGTAAVGPLVRDQDVITQRANLGRGKAEILASIHRQPVPSSALGSPPAAAAVAERETDRWIRALDHTPHAATPTMQAARQWLEVATPPPPDRVAIVHGDYRTGNLLYDKHGILGVLDWEMAHVGDPLEDVAWAQLASWRVGTGLVGAMLSDDAWIHAYGVASGAPVDVLALRFWQVLTGVKMSILAWRAYERVAPGKEHQLLHTLFLDLQQQLQANLKE